MAKRMTRQARILELVGKEDFETQEELCRRLNELGFKVTQATVSRDIRELGLTKTAGAGTKSVYRSVGPERGYAQQYQSIFKSGFVSADTAGHILVIRTVSGMAMGVAAAIDAMNLEEVAGSIAGDDTIFLAIHSESGPEEVMKKIDLAKEG